MSELGICPICGASDEYLIPVWEDMERRDKGFGPDYVGCKECNTIHEVEKPPERTHTRA